MNVLGKCKLYVNGFDGEKKGDTRLSCSVAIISKKGDDWETTFMPVVLSNSVKENLKLDKKSLDDLYKKDGKYGEDIKQKYNIKLEDNNAWLMTNNYEKNKKEVQQVVLFINDLTIVNDEEKKEERRSRR